ERLDRMRDLVGLAAAASVLFFDGYDERLRLLLDDRAATEDGPNPATRRSFDLQRYRQVDHDRTHWILFDRKGHPTDSTLPDATASGLDLQALFTDPAVDDSPRADRPASIGRPIDLPGEGWVMPMLRRHASARIAAVALIPLDVHRDLWRGLELPPRWAFGVLRDDGFLQNRFPPPADAVAMFGREHTGALLSTLRAAPAPSMQGVVSGPGTSFNGTDAFVAYQRLLRYGFTAYARMPADELTAAWWGRVRLPLMLACLIIAGFVLTALLTVRHQRRWEQERSAAQQQILRLAHFDALTDLPNRNLFNTHLTHSLERARRNGSQLGLLFIDLDRFKYINDALGHDVGDEVLRVVSGRLRDALRASDVLARLGGDEFVVLVEDLPNAEALPALGHKLLAAVDQPVVAGGRELTLSTSIGSSLYPDDGEDVRTLLKNADSAMYRAKEMGRNAFCSYAAALGRADEDRLATETALKRSLVRPTTFVLHYQPRVTVANGRITGFEALVRWQRNGVLIPPDQFVPLTEELGLVNILGRHVLGAACRQAAAWHAAGHHGLRVAVNISARHLHERGFVEDVRAALDVTSLPPAALDLEITESVMMDRGEQVAARLQELRELGVGLAVDDFGTGYSSLSYLRDLPLTTLKIDRSFVRNLPHDTGDVAITRAVIALARSLRLEVVAEGVETEAQRDFLAAEGVQELQGYLIGSPVDALAAERLLAADLEAEALQAVGIGY
ncbi:MAG: EAL domain-containing protein, partial [Burkholderiales bacterium]|nr:EAL domain-containing protein [Burkholderiales bacterium]